MSPQDLPRQSLADALMGSVVSYSANTFVVVAVDRSEGGTYRLRSVQAPYDLHQAPATERGWKVITP